MSRHDARILSRRLSYALDGLRRFSKSPTPEDIQGVGFFANESKAVLGMVFETDALDQKVILFNLSELKRLLKVNY